MLRLTMGGPTGIGGTALDAGYVNTKSIEFDGTGDHVRTYPDNSSTLKEILSGSPTAGKGFTISAWINSDWDASQTYYGISNGNATGISVQLTNLNIGGFLRIVQLQVRHSNSYNQTLSLGADYYNSGNTSWQHIVVTFQVDDSSSTARAIIKAYRNGGVEFTNSNGAERDILIAGAPSGSDLFNIENTTFIIGGVDLTTGTTSVAASKFDEFAIFNTHLSESEVQEIYNSGAPADLTQHSKAGNLVNYYRFEDDVTDTQGNQDGSAQGDPTFSTNVPS
tara:strand:+ start:70 stop:906 length:837 start_codon:yes stop_codon:yes gene_type:complete